MKNFLLIIISIAVVYLFPNDATYYKGNAEKQIEKYGELKVLSTVPRAGAIVDKEIDEVVITFSKNILPLQSVEDIKIKYSIEPQIEGVFRQKGSATLVFIPKKPLNPNVKYTFTIKKGLMAIDSSVMAADYSIIMGPVNLRSVRTPSSVMHPDSSIFLVFSYPLPIETLKEGITVLKGKERVSFDIEIVKLDEGEYYYNYYKPDDKEGSEFQKIKLTPKTLDAKSSYSIHIFMKGYMRNEEVYYFTTIGEFTYKHDGKVDYASYYGPTYINLDFTNSVNYIDLFKNVKFVAEGKEESLFDYYYSTSGTNFSIYKKVVPGLDYYIKISETLKDIYGNAITNPGMWKLEISDYSPFISFYGGMINSDEKLKLYIGMVNYDSFSLNIKEMSPSDYIKTVNGNDPLHSGKGYRKKNYKFNLKRNEFYECSLDVNQEFKNRFTLGMGYIEYETEYQNPDKDTQRVDFTYQVTPIMIHAVFSRKNGFIITNNRKSGEFVKGISALSIFNSKGNSLLKIPLENGILNLNKSQLSYFVSKSYYNSKYLYALHKEDACLMPYNLYKNETDYRAQIFTDKNLYKLNDSVFITGIVRIKEGNQIKKPDLKKLDYTVQDPNYKSVYKGKTSIDASGIFSLKLMIPDSFITGNYYVTFTSNNISLPYVYFLVQEFREPTFDVKIEGAKSKYAFDEPVEFSLSGEYLSGMKMSGDSLYIDFQVGKTSFYSANYPNFNFYISDDTAQIDDNQYDVKDTLRSDGKYNYNKNICYKKLKNVISVNAVSTVKGADKESVSRSIYFSKAMLEEYQGMRISHIDDTDDSTLIEYILVKSDETVIPGRKMKMVIVREFSYKDSLSDTIFNEFVVSGSKADSIWQKFEKGGYYRIDLINGGNKVSQSFYYGWWWYQSYDKTQVNIIPDKSSYEIGDTAKIKITVPDKNIAYYYYFGTDSIYDFKKLALNSDSSTISIPITKKMITGFYFNLFKLNEDTSDIYNLKTEFINVSYESKRISFTLTTDKETYQPQDSVMIKIKTEQNKEATAVITVVDESVLMLTNYRYSNPLSYFYGSVDNNMLYFSSLRPSDYYYGERYGMAEEKSYSIPSQSASKDGDNMMDASVEKELGSDKMKKSENQASETAAPLEIHIRKDFVHTPFYTVKVKFSKGNDGTVKFKLPDNIGKFRISVIAVTEDMFNLEEKSIRVEKKIIINSSLPNFLRPFDKFYASFLVLDNTQKDGSVECGIKSDQINFDNAQETILKPVNSKVLANFYGNASFEDSVTFLLSAKKEGYSDYLQIRIPIINFNLYEYSSTFASTENGVKEKIFISDDLVKDKSSITVSLNSTLIGGMDVPLDYLKNYRYLCLEQKLSRAFPYIIGEDVINLYKLSDIRGDKLRKYVSSLLKDLKSCQNSNGGFKYYEDDVYSSEYLSLYAMYVIYYAKKGGYNISDDIVDRGLNYLTQVIDNDFESIWSYSVYAKYSLRAYALYVMHLYGKNDYKDVVTEIYENRDKLYLAEKARLLEVLNSYKMTSEYNELSDEIKSNVRFETTYAYFDDGYYDWWFFSSDLRTTAIVLSSILKSEKKYEYAEQVMNLLNNRLKKGMWINTHTTAMVLEAITEYYKIYEKNTPLFTAYLKLNGKEIGMQKFSGRSSQQYQNIIKGANLLNGENNFEINKDGDGRLYYTLRMKYARNKVEKPLFNGFEVKREYLTLDGKPVVSFKKGEVYKVNIKVKTNKWRSFVVLEDNIPAGFDIIKREFVTEYVNLGNYNWKRGWWGYFYHEEFYKDRVVATSVYLYEGEHEYSYYVKAFVSGEFNAPPVNVFEMYTPEVFGYCGSEIIKIE